MRINLGLGNYIGEDGFFHSKYENGGKFCNFGISELSTATIIASISTAATVASAGLGAIGAMQQGKAASDAASYNAAVAANNAEIAKQNAATAAAAGNAQVEQAQLQTRAKIGGIIANEAAGNVDVTKGSALDVRSSAAQLGMLNALTVRSNAVRQAHDYQTQAAGYNAQAGLDSFEAKSASSAGSINALDTVIGGVGTAGQNYAKFLQTSGGSTINSNSGMSYAGQVAGNYYDNNAGY